MKKDKKISNSKEFENGWLKADMVLDNFDNETPLTIDKLDKTIASIKNKHDGENTRVRVNLITSNGKHFVSSDNLHISYDKEKDEIIIFNYV